METVILDMTLIGSTLPEDTIHPVKQTGRTLMKVLEPIGTPGFSESPEVSIVLPALNEARTIVECIEWCRIGFREAGVLGEVLIVDSSTDGTGELALASGARVLQTPKQGLGKAYIDALPHIRGAYVLLGDVDLTYDFRKINPFIESFRSGFQYIMGSRYRGVIEPGAMPKLHQYFGNPFTTWILNFIFRSRFSDIHCGMRGITIEAYRQMNLKSHSWEYASEMVIKSIQMGLRTTEVPVHFHKDREGRLSHHLRTGWWSPWSAGWINLQAMFIYGSNFFLDKPGRLLLFLGLSLTFSLILGPISLGPMTLSLYWMLLGVTLSLLGLQCLYFSTLAQVFFDHSGVASRRFLKRYRYTRSMVISSVIFLAGILMEIPLVNHYLKNGLRLNVTLQDASPHMAVGGLFFILVAFLNFTFTLVLHGFFASRNDGRTHDS